MDLQQRSKISGSDIAIAYGDCTADWISSRLTHIDRGMMEMMDKTYSLEALQFAALAAQELGLAMHLLAFQKAAKLAFRLQDAFDNPLATNHTTEQLIMDAITLRFELPCSTFM